MIELTLSADFSAAHFYSQPKWSETENKNKFGRCYSRFGHGHNYKIEITTLLENSDSYFQISSTVRQCLDRLLEILDHKHLNFDIAEFKTKIPTTENLAHYCSNEIIKTLSKKQVSRIRLYENPDLYSEITFQ